MALSAPPAPIVVPIVRSRAPSWRTRARSRPATRQLWRAGVFLAGLVCIVGGLALMVLPGPLTIPPVLLGLYLWSTEFAWARRLFDVFRVKARTAWRKAKAHPWTAGVVTAGGLLAAGAAIWAVGHFSLIARGGALIGL